MLRQNDKKSPEGSDWISSLDERKPVVKQVTTDSGCKAVQRVEHYPIRRSRSAMFVPPEMLANIFFICADRERDGITSRVPIATGFIVGRGSAKGDGWGVTYFVTARHVLESFGGLPLIVRVNRAAGGFVEFPIPPEDWIRSDEADVAAHPVGGDANLFSALGQVKFSYSHSESFITGEYRLGPSPEDRQANRKGCPVIVGDMLISPGLFVQEYGGNEGLNLPVARFGHVSRLPSTLVTPRWKGDTLKSEVYLAELLSWGGMSGSPVYWYRDMMAYGGGAVSSSYSDAIFRTYGISTVLGLVHGHFTKATPYDVRHPIVRNDIVGSVSVEMNAGMALIVPAHYIVRLLDREDVLAEREKILEKMRTTVEPTSIPDVTSMGGVRRQ